MKVVLDTNVLVAAFIAHGTCNELLEHCALHHAIVLSDFILGEFEHALESKFDFALSEVRRAQRLLRARCRLVEPAPLEQPLCRDPADDHVLGTAIAGACDCIITGDHDLLSLDPCRNMRIVSPSDFWRLENETAESHD